MLLSTKISSLEKILIEKDKIISESKDKIIDIMNKNQTIVKSKDEIIQDKNNIIKSKDRIIQDNNNIIKSKDRIIQDKDNIITVINWIMFDSNIDFSINGGNFRKSLI